jgi:hypothetical protein
VKLGVREKGRKEGMVSRGKTNLYIDLALSFQRRHIRCNLEGRKKHTSTSQPVIIPFITLMPCLASPTP